jgi:hypothetical protein
MQSPDCVAVLRSSGPSHKPHSLPSLSNLGSYWLMIGYSAIRLSNPYWWQRRFAHHSGDAYSLPMKIWDAYRYLKTVPWHLASKSSSLGRRISRISRISSTTTKTHHVSATRPTLQLCALRSTKLPQLLQLPKQGATRSKETTPVPPWPVEEVPVVAVDTIPIARSTCRCHPCPRVSSRPASVQLL